VAAALSTVVVDTMLRVALEERAQSLLEILPLLLAMLSAFFRVQEVRTVSPTRTKRVLRVPAHSVLHTTVETVVPAQEIFGVPAVPAALQQSSL
jgi:hypothetical protein